MASLRTLIFSLLPLWTTCLAQVQLANVTLPTNSSITETCIAVINQDVTCDSVLATLGRYDISGISYFLTSEQLTALCTSTCSTALSTWERRIAGACGSALWYEPDGSQSAPAAIAEQYVERYKSVCLTGSNGAYCNSVLANVLGVDPTDGQSTASAASTAPCNSCFLSLLQTQLEMPLASNTDIASLFTAKTSSCGSTGYSPTPTPTATTFTKSATSSSTSATATCSGTSVTLSSSSTCLGISETYGISTYDLLQQNGLPSLCYEFPTSGTVCVPDPYTCEPYVVQSGDTCSSVQSQYGILFSQIIAWNPALGTGCGNMAKYVGYAICVSVPGGAWVNPSPTAPNGTTTTGFATWTLPAVGSLPTAVNLNTSNSTSTNTPASYADNTRLDCSLYVTAPVLTNFSANTTSLLCDDVVGLYPIELSDFISWNPSLNDSNPCTMLDDTQYCVQLSQTVAENITDACTGWDIAPAGYDCLGFTSLLGLDIDQFIAWNLGVGANCTDFSVGTSYCTTVYHYRQAGIVSTCNEFTMPNDTNWVNQPCQSIETKYGISHARFVAWNPAVQTDCSGLYLGYDYCVSIPNYKPVYTTVSSTGLGSPWYPSSFQTAGGTAAITQAAVANVTQTTTVKATGTVSAES